MCIRDSFEAGTAITKHVDNPKIGDVIISITLKGDAEVSFRPATNRAIVITITEQEGGGYAMFNAARRHPTTHEVLAGPTGRIAITLRYRWVANNSPEFTTFY